MCGAEPGRMSAGWQSEPEPVERVNCPRCLKKLEILKDIDHVLSALADGATEKP